MALFHTTVLDNQIKALPTVDTASGAIATFDTDLTENLVEVKCQIVAKQASGTPSSVNPLPITTYTEMNVRTRNKNFISLVDDTVQTDRKTSITVNSITNNSIDMTSGGSAYACFGRYLYLKAGKYTVSLKATASDSYNPTATIYKGSSVIVSGINNTTSKTFTVSTDGIYELRMFATGSGDTTIRTVTYSEIQIEKGEYKTDFVAYNGTTSNIPFGQTVSNGVLDITTGKLRVTHRYRLFDGSESWNSAGGGFYLENVLTDISGTTSTGAPICICNKYTETTAIINSSEISGKPDNTYFNQHGIYIMRLWIKDTSQADVTAFKTSLSNTPLQIVYPLATPIEIQLDSITLQALLNENNIWCDTGDTEVKFLLTVGKKIS